MALKLNERYPGRFDNPSASYPQGAFKNRTSPTSKDGSYLERDWANDKEGFFQSLLSSAGVVANGSVDAVGASQYYDALVLAIRKSASGVVGQARNLAITVAAVSATATVTADEVVVESALGGLRYCLPSLNKTINLGTTGAGGMDTGTAPANGFVALYAIYNPTTGTSALLGVNATSAVAPEVYGGANMPSGYTASALVSVAPISATPGQFSPFVQVARDISTNQVSVFNSTAAGSASYTSISLSAAVPLNARAAQVIWSVQQASAGTGVSMNMASNSAGLLALGVQSITTGGTAAQSTAARFPLVVAQTLYYATNASAATRNATICGYQF